MTKKATEGTVKSDLLDQLDRNGIIGEYYTDMIGDYMALWKIKNELQADVRKRGAKVTKYDSQRQPQLVNNESIDQSLKVNAQMLKILDALGIRPVEAESTNGGEDDEL